ncbi:PaaI family thioesterase [Caldovatus aquaticus]|uniref:PaaI family thioesterase n=1 Tax=Caldovatus aquaticus TaxID=2865671 RepID=A0ABS7F4Z7_9PROT|nr:PaaI family thioesterase [Caldovatus aquaticus]MBW8270701.1 PaaI family thioesterase [Caldovatus aquaticus]
MSDAAPSRAEIRRILTAGVPLAEAWGVEVLEAAEGRALLRLPPSPALLRPGGTVSGPAMMGLADMAVWCALLSLTGGRDESLTANLTINFLRRPGAAALLAEARVLRRGRLPFAEAWLRAEDAAEPCAHVTTTWAAVPPPRR